MPVSVFTVNKERVHTTNIRNIVAVSRRELERACCNCVQAQTTETKRVEMATQAEEDPSCVAAEEADLVRVRLLRNMSPHTLSSLLAVERDAFPECERLGNYMQELSMQRNNGLVIAEDHRPPPGTFPGAFPAPLAEAQGFLLFSRTAEAGVIMKIAVAAAFRGRGVGTALLR
jgi:GNAT superfamily N-acetyltransferase